MLLVLPPKIPKILKAKYVVKVTGTIFVIYLLVVNFIFLYLLAHRDFPEIR